jgi:hypothetical protein
VRAFVCVCVRACVSIWQMQPPVIRAIVCVCMRACVYVEGGEICFHVSP